MIEQCRDCGVAIENRIQGHKSCRWCHYGRYGAKSYIRRKKDHSFAVSHGLSIVCVDCGVEKPASDYYKSQQSYCKPCFRIRVDSYKSEKHGGALYAVAESPTLEYVKIGFATNIKKRIDSLQVGNIRDLVLIGSCEGSRDDEKHIHYELQNHRVRGEWFKFNDPVKDALADFGMVLP